MSVLHVGSSRWGATRPTTSSTLSKLSKSAMSRRILPSMARSVGTALRAKQPSTDAPLAIPVMRSASASASGGGDLRLGKIDRRTRPAQGPRHREGEDHLRPWAGRPMSTFRDHAVANHAAPFAARTRQDRNRAEEAAPARIHMRGMRSADGPSLERIGPSKGRFASKAALKPTSPPSRGVLLQ